MKNTTVALIAILPLIVARPVSGFAAARSLSKPTRTIASSAIIRDAPHSRSRLHANLHNPDTEYFIDKFVKHQSPFIPPLLPVVAATTTATFVPSPAMAAAAGAANSVVPSALWAYGHFFSILVIVGCLTAERIIVKADMTTAKEDLIVKCDLVYGLMAALLIISGFARATTYGQGGDYYIHEILFWVKMTVSGVWGGLSLFPSLTFYKRNFARKNDEEVPPVSEKLAGRLHQIINAEISAILSIPILATLMARGVWYSPDFPYQIGLAVSLAATGGSFYFYGRQALSWKEDGDDELQPEKQK